MHSTRSRPPASDYRETSPISRRRAANAIAMCFFVGFLALQIVVPLAQLAWSPRPARFGWQMYSVISAAPRFELMLHNGTAKPLDVRPYVTSMRGDVPLARFLPPHLCTLFPDAAAIKYQMDDGSQAGTFQCTP
jgi:hypothetical protein